LTLRRHVVGSTNAFGGYQIFLPRTAKNRLYRPVQVAKQEARQGSSYRGDKEQGITRVRDLSEEALQYGARSLVAGSVLDDKTAWSDIATAWSDMCWRLTPFIWAAVVGMLGIGWRVDGRLEWDEWDASDCEELLRGNGESQMAVVAAASIEA
jgi:hypothetical protein